MQLNEKDQKRKQHIDQQIKTVNLDMTILNGISGKNLVAQGGLVKKAANLTLNQLAQVLKNKNDRSTHLQAQKSDVKEWLKDKGVNLKKINQQIYENAKVSSEIGIFLQPKQPTIKPIGISTLKRQIIPTTDITLKQPLPTFTQETQSQFINKQKQVSINRQILKSMKQSQSQNNFRNTLNNKLKKLMPSNQQAANKSIQQQNKQAFLVLENEERVNEETKKNDYFDFVESFLRNGFTESNKRLKDIRPFWKIVLKHIETIQHYAPLLEKEKSSYLGPDEADPAQLRLNAHIMYKSLKMIEHNFSKSLPDTTKSYEQLDEIIKNMQKRNRKLKVWRNSKGEPSWARAFMLLRAGRKDQVKRVLQNVDRQFLRQFLAHEESLSKVPTPSYTTHEYTKYKDSFYTQLLYIIEANPKFQPQILQDDDLSTKSWLMLRTISLYRFDPHYEATHINIGKSITDLDAQSSAPLTTSTVENYLHLGMYRNLISLVELATIDKRINKQLEGFDQDDCFHLLLVVSIYPQLWANTSQKARLGIQIKLVKQLTQYMRRLRNDGFYKETAKYLLLVPEKQLPQVACQLITTREHFEKFEWDTFRQILRLRDPQTAQKIYLEVSKKVLDSLKLNTFKDFLFAANLYKSTYGQLPDSKFLEQKCYVKLLLQHLFFVEKKRYLVRRGEFSNEFTGEMFGFFEINQQDASKGTQLQRLDDQVNRQVRECELILRKSLDLQANDKYLMTIAQPFIFYETVSKLANLLQNPSMNYQQLKQFDNRLMYKNLPTETKPLQHILNLLQFFRQQLPTVTPLYVFYLTMLIQRKRIITTQDCDYSGLPVYIEGVLKNLEGLDTLCRHRIENVRDMKFKDDEERKRVMAANENQLDMYQEYREFMQDMYQYLRQYGGMYGMGLEGINNGKLLKKTTGVLV